MLIKFDEKEYWCESTVILCNRQVTQTMSMTITLNRQIGISRRSVII